MKKYYSQYISNPQTIIKCIYCSYSNIVHTSKLSYSFKISYSSGDVPQRKIVLKLSQNSHKNICAGDSFLIKLQAWLATLQKKRLWRRSFPVDFAKILRTSILQNIYKWLFLIIKKLTNKTKFVRFSSTTLNVHFFQISWKNWHYQLCGVEV